MRDALNATGRPIWFALCGWSPWYATDAGGGQALGNSWRVGVDTGSGWGAVMTNVANGLLVAASNVPGPAANGAGGAWSDGSLLLNPGMGSGANLMDNARSQSMFGLWCVLGFNLVRERGGVEEKEMRGRRKVFPMCDHVLGDDRIAYY